MIKGEHKNGVMVFVGTEHKLRTDDLFDQGAYNGTDDEGDSNHQIQPSCLVGRIKCIKQMPLDAMHLICLGAVRRMIKFWNKGAPTSKAGKLPPTKRVTLANRVEELHGKLPREFARQPKQFNHSETWKATELRQFLLFVGPVILRNILSQDYLVHFLSLSIAYTILCYKNFANRQKFLDYARQLLKFYVNEASELYSEEFMSNNIHSLLHIADDVENLDCAIMDISAFPFESFMSVLKSMVRGSTNQSSKSSNVLTSKQQQVLPENKRFRQHS